MSNAFNNYDPLLHDEKYSPVKMIRNEDGEEKNVFPNVLKQTTWQLNDWESEDNHRSSSGKTHYTHSHGEFQGHSVLEHGVSSASIPQKKRIYLLCDDFVGRSTLREFLEKEGFDVTEAMFAECLSKEDHEDYATVLVDLGTSQMSLSSLRDYLQESFSMIPVILIDEPHQNADRVRLLKEFAFSYIMRPCNRKELLSRIEYAILFTDLLRENHTLRQSIGMPPCCPELYGTSYLCEGRRRQISAYAKLGGSVLLCGDNGSGKLLTAQQIHLSGARSRHPFQVVHCTEQNPITLDALLFGHTKETFPGLYGERAGLFELVDGGTIYFSQIMVLPLLIQEKLSRYLKDGYYIRNGAKQPKQVNVQIIAGTSQNLSVACLTNSFLEELYYQLSMQTMQLVNLKELVDDIPAFVRTLLTLYARFTWGQVLMISDEAMRKLQRHTWPGNFNEFYEVIYRACLRTKNSMIEEKSIVFAGPTVTRDRETEYLGLAGMTIAEVERRLIIETLAANGGNRSLSARQLGVSEKTIYNKSKQYKLKNRI